MIKQTIIGAAFQITGLPMPTADEARLKLIMTVVFSVMGAIAALVVAIGGLRYVLSHGDPSAVAQAKNMILYALIGLVVCIAGVSIVTFTVGRVG